MAHAVSAMRRPNSAPWLVVHALYADCRCSQRIVEHLLKRRALHDAAEHVLLVGVQPELEKSLNRAGFQTQVITPLELKSRFGAVAAPLLIVAGPDDRLRYVGGYTTHKQGPDIRDLDIIRGLMQDQPRAELPLFGCAVSRSLQRLLDPFSLKY